MTADEPPISSSERIGRWRGVITGGVAMVGARGISMVASLAVVPVVAHRMDPGEFGLWLTLTTAFTTLAVLDFGVGLAVMGQVSAARGHGDGLRVQRVVSTALVVLTAAAFVLILIAGILAYACDWNGALGVQREVPRELVRQLVFVVAVASAVSLPLAVAGRVYQAVQRARIPALAIVLGVALKTGGLFGVAALTPDLRFFFGVFLVASLAADVATTVLLMARSEPELRPRWRHVDWQTAVQLGREGTQLFIVNVIGVIAYKADAFLIGHYLGTARVPEYLLPFSVFALIPTFMAMFLTPLWAAYREAWARGERAWVRNAYVRSVVLTTTAGVVASAVLAPLTPSILRVWMGDEAVSPSTGQLVALACFTVVMCTSSAVAVFLNGLGALRPQLWLGLVMAGLNIVASIWSVTHIGVAGPLWATVVTQTLVVLIPCMVYARRRLGAP